MEEGAGLDSGWIWNSLKYCGDGPLDMSQSFEGGCIEISDRKATQCCCLGDR